MVSALRCSLPLISAAVALSLPLGAWPAAPTPASQDAPRGWLDLPEDPLGRLWASVGAGTAPWRSDQAPGDLKASDTAWAEWRRAMTETRVPERRREALSVLLKLAANDGRMEDAYGWIRAFGADDAPALAGSIPLLFPGLAPTAALGGGGRPGPLAEGALLRPQLPPRSRAALPGSIETRRVTARGLQVGGTTFDLMLKVDGSGVIAEFTHVAGGPAELRVALPAPEGFRLKSVYVDWELQDPGEEIAPGDVDWSGTPLLVRVVPAEDPISLFARLDRRETPLPTAPAPGAPLPETITNSGLLLVVPEEEQGPRWGAMASAFAEVLGVPVRVGAPQETRGAGGGQTPTALRFDLAADPEALRRRVTHAIEARFQEG
ncbi:MAG: hypothetical protein P8M11_01510 [Planctomycetota bacterium]|nr:hypothetical protein [Planctomycetota bacterium]